MRNKVISKVFWKPHYKRSNVKKKSKSLLPKKYSNVKSEILHFESSGIEINHPYPPPPTIPIQLVQ